MADDRRPVELELTEVREQAVALEEEVSILRRRLADAPKRVRTLEEKLLETKGQLAQAVSQNEKLTYTLREAREHIAALREAVDKLTRPPFAYGTFLGANDDGSVDVLSGGRKMRVSLHPGLDIATLQKGQEVVLNDSFNIVLAQPMRELPDGPIWRDEPDPLRTLLEQAGITEAALVHALRLQASPGSTTISTGLSAGGRLTASEVALFEAEGLDLSPLEPGADDPVARTAATAARLLATALTVEAAATHLRTSEADVVERLRNRSLYGAEGGLLPEFQFTDESLVPGIDRVLRAAPEDLHIVELWGWLTNIDPNLDVGGRPYSPRDWLMSGGDSARVVELAAQL